MTYRGHVKNGVAVLDEPTSLPEGAEMEVDPSPEKDDQRAFGHFMIKWAGAIQGLSSDLAKNHDHCIHGTPKK